MTKRLLWSKKSYGYIVTGALSLLLTMNYSCKKDNDEFMDSVNDGTEQSATTGSSSSGGGTSARTSKLSGTNSSARTKEEEIAFITGKANSVAMNSSGYVEATFDHGIVMIYVPAGSFTMGNDDISGEMVQGFAPSPAHKVNLDHYWICKTPVTTGQFRAFVQETSYVTDVEKPGHAGPFVYVFEENGFVPKPGYHWDNAFKDVTAKFPALTVTDEHPVSCVSWNDAIAFTNWLKGKTGVDFTLPTEAEWERAARGTDQRVYPWGNQLPDGTKANYADDTFEQYFPGTGQAHVHKGVNDGYGITSPVLAFPGGISPVGAYDMAGNLIEWVYDAGYDYEGEETTNPINLDGTDRLQRGGFWVGGAGRIGVTPDEIKDGHNIRSDSRESDGGGSADDHLGFRIGISYTTRSVITSVIKVR